MRRPAKNLGKLAAAALAAATLALAPGPARSQQPAEQPAKEPAKIVVPGGDTPLDLSKKRAARNASVRIVEDRNNVLTITRPVTPQGQGQGQFQVQVQIQGLPPGIMVPAANQAVVAAPPIQPLRPIFQRELRLLTTTVQPTPSQRREIALEAGRTLRAYLGANGNVLIANGVQVNPAGRMGVVAYDPTKVVRQHLELAAWSKLSNVQSAKYRSELDRKERDRREVVVLNVVATLDKHLNLDAQQREKLREVLHASWDDRDYPAIVTGVDYDHFVAIVPPLYIGPILTQEQRQVWAGLRKVHLATVRGVEPAGGPWAVDLDDEEDEDVKAALAEGPR